MRGEYQCKVMCIAWMLVNCSDGHRFRASGNGNSNARVISHVLQRNKWIEELDLSNNGLDDDGIREIAAGIAKNEGVKHLNLSSNHFGEVGAMYLSQAIRQNSVLRRLDLSRNALGFRSISILRTCCEPKDIEIDTFGNYVFEEILNSVTHGIAFLGSVIGANVLISDTMEVHKTDYHFWACVLYSFALMFLFLSSCLFHSFFMLPTSKCSLSLSFSPIVLCSRTNELCSHAHSSDFGPCGHLPSDRWILYSHSIDQSSSLHLSTCTSRRGMDWGIVWLHFCK